jgi:hypothetical protein
MAKYTVRIAEIASWPKSPAPSVTSESASSIDWMPFSASLQSSGGILRRVPAAVDRPRASCKWNVDGTSKGYRVHPDEPSYGLHGARGSTRQLSPVLSCVTTIFANGLATIRKHGLGFSAGADACGCDGLPGGCFGHPCLSSRGQTTPGRSRHQPNTWCRRARDRRGRR